MSSTTTRPPRRRRGTGEGDGPVEHHRVAVIGGGFCGLAAVHHLRRRGIRDLVVLERAHDVGGVWRANTYPGIACDVPSHLYSLSFAPNPDWARTFSDGGQIWEYCRRVADDLGMAEVTRFGEEVLEAAWDAGAQRWRIRTTTLTLTADVLVDGSGVLPDPAYPDIPGRERFAGAVFHSARWNHDHDLAGERVAVVGTGASAVQIVPAIQPSAGHVTIFQRTPGWVLPRWDRDITETERRVLRRVPLLQRLLRAEQFAYRDGVLLEVMHSRRMRRFFEAVSRAYLRRTIADPVLRAQLTPDFEIGCKRILITSRWYPALTRPNVTLVPAAVREIRERSVVAADGSEHEVDTLVFATGFHVTDPPIAGVLRGRDGRTLAETWGDAPTTYRGVTTANFPNFFKIGSVGTGTGHTSQILQIESGVHYLCEALRTMDELGLAGIEVTAEAQAAHARRLHEMASRTVWVTGGCRSWYLDGSGEASALWPSSAWAYRRWTERFDVEAYAVVRRAEVASPEPAAA